jgi:hypothetical protein
LPASHCMAQGSSEPDTGRGMVSGATIQTIQPNLTAHVCEAKLGAQLTLRCLREFEDRRLSFHQNCVLLKSVSASHPISGMACFAHLSRCAFGVTRLAFGSGASPRIYASCSKSLPCGLVVGKSLMSATIVVENSFRPVNGRSAEHR